MIGTECISGKPYRGAYVSGAEGCMLLAVTRQSYQAIIYSYAMRGFESTDLVSQAFLDLPLIKVSGLNGTEKLELQREATRCVAAKGMWYVCSRKRPVRPQRNGACVAVGLASKLIYCTASPAQGR